MHDTGKAFVQFFVSLKLTVVLLALSAILVFAATLDQTHLGIWGIQEKWFRSLVVLQDFKGVPVPIFPGGYFIGTLLLINLIAAHIYRFTFNWKKSGIFITHLGLIILLVGELLTNLWQQDFQMRLTEGESKNYSESPRKNELAVIDTTDPEYDHVVAIPEALLRPGKSLQTPKLPFRLVVRDYFPNASLQMRSQVPNAPASLATTGIGPQVAVTPLPMTYKENETNVPAAYVELIGPQGSINTWLFSTALTDQTFQFEGKTYRFVLRPERFYTKFTVSLLKFSHDRFAGTEIDKNFSSRVRLQTDDGSTDREVLIYMNNPLRFQGLTFYQAGYDGDKTTFLQVVKNPSWLLPYVACAMIFAGLVIQFGLSLVGFAKKRSNQLAVA
ncbi:MAG TPA: cytochrome c biogenesis protein ResB [Opitutaceae bacterium]|nr:cytochrome c biogenesis protein ResB [Opitutaceae bacterium]